MEQRENQAPSGGTPLEFSDRDAFSRVWERVMGSPQSGPVEVAPFKSALQAAAPLFENTAGQTQTGTAAPSPAASTSPSTPAAPSQQQTPAATEWGAPGNLTDGVLVKSAEDLPPEVAPINVGIQSGLNCFGEEAQTYVLLMEEVIDSARSGIVKYQTLSKRNPRFSKGFLALADNLRQVYRVMSAAYFLTTGTHYQGEVSPPETEPTVAAALRTHFIRSQRWANAARRAAEETKDPCLTEAFLTVADTAEANIRQIRTMVEQLYT